MRSPPHDERPPDLVGLTGCTIAMPVDTTLIGNKSYGVPATPDQVV
jgi:hypothetical protein